MRFPKPRRRPVELTESATRYGTAIGLPRTCTGSVYWVGGNVHNPDDYFRAQADRCRALAASAHGEDAEAQFLNIASVWLRIASEASAHGFPRQDIAGRPLTFTQ